MNSATDRRGYVLEHRTQLLRRSTSFKVTEFGTNRKLIRLAISDSYKLTSYLAPFPSYG